MVVVSPASGAKKPPVPVLEAVKKLKGGPFYTVHEVAEKIGRSVDTIKRWTRNPNNKNLRPFYRLDLSDKSFVWLYTEEDVKRLREHAQTVRSGRPTKRVDKDTHG